MPAIQPTNPQPTPQPVPNSGTPDTTKKAEQLAPAKATKATAPAKTQSKPSPLKEQARDVRGQPDYSPVQIVILNGAHKGKSLDLGIAVNEIQHSETAEWESQDGDGIRVGVNFKKLSPREISLSLVYYSAVEDVSHLVENLKHLKEITEGEARPPLLLFTQGSMQASECVCVSLRDKYSEPHPGKRGLRRADVEITLLMGGGKNSAQFLGAPLTSTPLGDERAKQTEAERQKQGLVEVTRKLFAPCLGEKGSEAIAGLIDKDKLKDPTEIAKLSSGAFVQGAIAGLFPPSLLQDPKLQAKLISDLATETALNEDGVGTTINARKFAQGLITGKFPESNEALQNQLDRAKPDFDLLLQAIATQSLSESSPVFDRSKFPTAGERLIRLGSCGLSLRRVGGTGTVVAAKKVSPVEATYAINNFIGNKKPSDEEIRQRFGESLTNTQIKALKNGSPYQSKEEFIAHNSQNADAIVGTKMFNSFIDNSPELTEE